MPIDPSSAPNLTRTDTFKPELGYVAARIQQGSPILDTDVNDGDDYTRHQALQQIRSLLGWDHDTHATYEWLVRPVSLKNYGGSDDRNIDNFAVMLGRLSTKHGIVDLKTLDDPSLTDYVIFDWQNIADNATDIAQDRPYANYLFKGAVTDTSVSTSELVDTNKLFVANHRLVATTQSVTTLGSPGANPEGYAASSTINPHKLTFTEEACRVVMLSGAAAGEERSIASHTADTLTLSSGFSVAPSAGDLYVILPPNTLETHRLAWNAKTIPSQTAITEGLNAGKWLVFYVQTFLDDVSPDEDSDMALPAAGETSHRTELRWCIRVTQVAMSTATDGGYAQLHEAHVFQALARDRAMKRNRDLLDRGAAGSTPPHDEDPTDGSLMSGTWPVGGGVGISGTRPWTGTGPMGNEGGLTYWHHVTGHTSELYRNHREFPNGPLLFEFLQAAMEGSLVATGSVDVGYTPLMVHFPAAKTDLNTTSEVLSVYWAQIPVAYDPPVTHSRLDITPELLQGYFDAGAGYVPHLALALQRPQPLQRPQDSALELVQARGIGYNSTKLGGSERGGLLVSPVYPDGDYYSKVPLTYASVGEHLAALDTMVRGITGIGHQQGYVSPAMGGEVAGGLPGLANTEAGRLRLASSRNFVPTGEVDSLFQSGQSNLVWLWDKTKQLNPLDESRGAITPIDPLVGQQDGAGLNAVMQGSAGKFAGGPGEYKLRGGGTVLPNDTDGWSHYAEPTGFGTENRTITRPRYWQEGIAQAITARDALMFRKLAIKTSAHDSMDMFTYRIHNPQRIHTLGAFKAGFAQSAIGLLQTAVHRTDDPARVGAENVTSYNAISQYRFAGESTGETHSTSKGGESIEAVDSATYLTAGGARLDASSGPWGRYDGALSDSWVMWDQWENRCTVFRLRYHIGDFYPADYTEETQHDADYTYPPNALVDTLNLFVRFEPLPLTHWATMPKHQHEVLTDSMSMLSGLKNFLLNTGITPSLGHLMSGAVPLVTAYSPEGVEGDADPNNYPFAHKHQPYVHWYHPHMEYIKGPHPGTDDYGANTQDQPVPYRKWGERSLIIPAITSMEPPASEDALANGTANVPGNWKSGDTNVDIGSQSFPASVLTSSVANNSITLDTFRGSFREGDTVYIYGHTGSTPDINGVHVVTRVRGPLELEIDVDITVAGTGGFAARHDSLAAAIGNHFNDKNTIAAEYHTVTIEATDFTVRSAARYFPFVPSYGDGGVYEDHGYPGPVFFPAFRKFKAMSILGGDSEAIGMHPVINSAPVGVTNIDEATYYPTVDYNSDAANAAAVPAGAYNWGMNVAAMGFKLPVLRVALRTDTVSAILGLFDGTVTWVDSGYTPPDQGLQQPAAGPDVNQDTMFLGSLGTSVAKDGAAALTPVFYPSANLFGGLFYATGHARAGQPALPGDYDTVWADAFQQAQAEREVAIPTYIPTAMNNTWSALKDAGLAQKLLFNSSFRVLHSRPGGGYHDGLGGPVPKADRARSLTELFIVRNRQTGAAVPMPWAPDAAYSKPYLHFESMHPAAAGGGGFTAHPNNALVGHLYPMISDNLGAQGEGVSSGDLYGSTATDDTNIGVAEFLDERYATGVTGDTFGADPFDYELGNYADAVNNRQARTDRLQQNSGIEIDLVSELRYVRENAAAHGLSATGAAGFKLLDTMPTVEEMTAPGDHEIMFVLYTGSYGQRMGNPALIPAEAEYHNPPFAGCRVVASIEVNRPNEKVSSDAGGSGRHYGHSIRTFHVLGHS